MLRSMAEKIGVQGEEGCGADKMGTNMEVSTMEVDEVWRVDDGSSGDEEMEGAGMRSK